MTNRIPLSTPSPSRCSQAGFSLLELLVASVAASVLALTAGSMLVYAWISWRDVQEGCRMQQDAAITLTWIRNRVGETAPDNISANTGRLEFTSSSGRSSALYHQGSDLLYDPDVATDGDETTIVHGRMQSFSPSVITNLGRSCVTVDFGLSGDVGHDSTSFSTTVALRQP